MSLKCYFHLCGKLVDSAVCLMSYGLVLGSRTRNRELDLWVPSSLRYSMILQWLMDTHFVKAEWKIIPRSCSIRPYREFRTRGRKGGLWLESNIGILKSSKTGRALFPNLDICGNRVRKNTGSDVMAYTCKDAQNHSAVTYLVIL